MRMRTTSSWIDVRALVGPRPVYSATIWTAAFEIAAVMLPAGGGALVVLDIASLPGRAPLERGSAREEEKRLRTPRVIQRSAWGENRRQVASVTPSTAVVSPPTA